MTESQRHEAIRICNEMQAAAERGASYLAEAKAMNDRWRAELAERKAERERRT